MAIGYPAVYPDLPGQATGAIRHVGPGRGHMGLERAGAGGRAFRPAVHGHRPANGNRCSSTAWRRSHKVCAFACSTARTACSTCSGGTWTHSIRPAQPKFRRQFRTSSKTCTGAWTSWSGGRWPNARSDRHTVDGHLGPRFQHVPPRHRPEPLAGGERLSGRRRCAAARRSTWPASIGPRLVPLRSV